MKQTLASDLDAALSGLLAKYAVRPAGPWRLFDGRGAHEPSDGAVALVPGWALGPIEPSGHTIPLFPWRHERRFVELKRLVDDRTIEPLLMVRFACLTDGRELALDEILYREIDLAEWLGGSRVARLHGTVAEGRAANVVLRLESGVVCGIEAGTTLPSGTPMQDRHELIARRGVASDRAVDTQVAQSSIYLWSDRGSRRHTDVDFELFECDAGRAALVRSALAALREPERAAARRAEHRRLRRLVALVFESDRRRERLPVEGGVA